LFWLLFFVGLYAVHYLYTRRSPLKLDKNSVVVITGACNGIGRQTARILAQRYKCKFIILDIMYSKFREVSAELEALGSVVTCFPCDLRSESSMNNALFNIRQSGATINVLINNAGIVVPKNFDKQTYADHVQTMAVNYLAPVFLTLGLRDRLKDGHVVTIASVASLMPGKQLSSYVASKHAIYGFFNCLRTELASRGDRSLTCSLICPYTTDTGFLKGFETRLNKIIPVLKEAEVGRIIADTVINRQEIVFIPFWIGFVVKLGSLLPECYKDKLVSWLDKSNYESNPELKTE